MITFKQTGDFEKLEAYLKSAPKRLHKTALERFGEEGVRALSSATPIDSGYTAESWYYKIEKTNTGLYINFYNSNIVDGVPIAIILQYGHGTGTGGYVQGRDYINPALQPVFDQIIKDFWEEVTNL